MNLSSLMRLGAIASPQLPDLEAAYFAKFGRLGDAREQVYGLGLVGVDACHPVTGETLSVAAICCHLTDEQGWTIWQIIDWLESEEL